MAAEPSLNAADMLREHLQSASPDLLRAMVKTFADVLMSAEVDAVCNAEYGERSDERTNSRNGYRRRDWDTRAGTVELAIPKQRAKNSDTIGETIDYACVVRRIDQTLTETHFLLL